MYVYSSTLFGATCSQFLLKAITIKHVASIKEDQRTINTIMKGMDIDNLQGTGSNQRLMEP